jgi:ribosomal protein L33
MVDIDLFKWFKCEDCGNVWYISGSTSLHDIKKMKCSKCNSFNYILVKNINKK